MSWNAETLVEQARQALTVSGREGSVQVRELK